MTKTIEEAAKRNAEKAMEASCGRQKTWGEIVKVYENLFLDGVKHVMSLPLADRLDDDEKDFIKECYIKAEGFYKSEQDLLQVDPDYAEDYYGAVWRCQMELLKSIFGSDFFQDPPAK